MTPVISEVVAIFERGSDSHPDIPQFEPPFVDDFALMQRVLRIGNAVNAPADPEFVQVRVFPSHDDLQHIVEAA
jgi:hypothetical protein